MTFLESIPIAECRVPETISCLDAESRSLIPDNAAGHTFRRVVSPAANNGAFSAALEGPGPAPDESDRHVASGTGNSYASGPAHKVTNPTPKTFCGNVLHACVGVLVVGGGG